MSAYEDLSPENRRKVDALLEETKANAGLAPVDLDQWWADQAVASKDPFGTEIPQVPLGAICNWECIFDELGIEQDWRRYQREDPAWALSLRKQYNELAEPIVGKRLLNEDELDPNPVPGWPKIKELHDIFEAENVWEGGKSGSWWLKQSADSPAELVALLDRVEKRLENLPAFMLPENWTEEKARLTGLGRKVPRYRGQRGPCTFACSIFGAENLLFLFYDDPDLFTRFGDVIGRAILARAKVLDDEAGFSDEDCPKGWNWFDDNCCLFNVDMYEAFAMPIHRAVFAKYAPDPNHTRGQHSDSNMAHLLPLLSEVNLKWTNFGPTLTVSEIREHCPNAVIRGQLAPFTFSRDDHPNMVAEFLRDFEQAKEKRGLNFATAGSINNGSSLRGMRLLMATIQRYGRYE